MTRLNNMNGNKKIVLGFVGKIAAGKGLAVEYLRSKYEIDVFRFSDFIRKVLTDIDMPESRENIQRMSLLLRQFAGEDLLSKLMFKQTERSEKELCIIDGIRRPEDIIPFRPQNNFFLIAIAADPRIRYERTTSRGENSGDSQKTWEEFSKDDEAETEKTIDGVVRTADFFIENNDSKKEFFNKIDTILDKLKLNN